ncbi:reverse transcriptase [Gossypium australe]|uniref:Reverse transcriptase n=1 Tax=Gossypium australe TaxID=47621 RepID=A0A5B6WNU3_9ROSI|nr:reverse transcriptase [Gossypium australe]
MRLACEGNKISGAKVCRGSPTITHLMFADDCIMFGEASNRGVNVFKDILTEYEACSGQCVNFEKSTVFFSSNVNEQDRNLVVQVLGVRCSNDPEKYLGLPNMVGCKRKWVFQELKDGLKQRINNWSIRHFTRRFRKYYELILVEQKQWQEMNALILWAAKGLILQGMDWRIGDGKNVSIWNDKWIPGNEMLNSQNSDINSNLEKVADLFESNIRRWNEDLVCNTFTARVSEKILCIPLSRNLHEDFGIWTFRNKLIHENEIKTGTQIAEFVSNYLRELDRTKQILPDRSAYTNRWEAPAGMCWRINFDAAFNRQRNESCSGLVIRNGRAEVLCSKTIINKNIPTAFAAEALGCYQAIDLGLQLGLRDVEIEGDARTVIKKLQGKEEDRSKIAAYIKDSKEMALQFRFCVFLFLNREANEVAHEIASEGLKKKENTYLSKRVPTDVEPAVMADRRRTENEQEQRRRSCYRRR